MLKNKHYLKSTVGLFNAIMCLMGGGYFKFSLKVENFKFLHYFYKSYLYFCKQVYFSQER